MRTEKIGAARLDPPSSRSSSLYSSTLAVNVDVMAVTAAAILHARWQGAYLVRSTRYTAYHRPKTTRRNLFIAVRTSRRPSRWADGGNLAAAGPGPEAQRCSACATHRTFWTDPLLRAGAAGSPAACGLWAYGVVAVTDDHFVSQTNKTENQVGCCFALVSVSSRGLRQHSAASVRSPPRDGSETHTRSYEARPRGWGRAAEEALATTEACLAALPRQPRSAGDWSHSRLHPGACRAARIGDCKHNWGASPLFSRGMVPPSSVCSPSHDPCAFYCARVCTFLFRFVTVGGELRLAIGTQAVALSTAALVAAAAEQRIEEVRILCPCLYFYVIFLCLRAEIGHDSQLTNTESATPCASRVHGRTAHGVLRHRVCCWEPWLCHGRFRPTFWRNRDRGRHGTGAGRSGPRFGRCGPRSRAQWRCDACNHACLNLLASSDPPPRGTT